MKRIFTLLFASALSMGVSGQTFWTEDFGTGCNTGQQADGVATANGTWTVASTGANDPEANVWYLSAAQGGTGTGNCATRNCANNNRTIHIGANDGFSANDAGATYNAGGLCGLLFCVVTNTRVQSPTINCSGKSNITLKFNYSEDGDGANDNGTCWYYDGTTWSQIADMNKAVFCTNGRWTSYSVALPSSANNNPNVKIGFNWTNNDDGVGSDPSFAIDDIELSIVGGGVPPVSRISYIGDTASCTPMCLGFSDNSTGSPTSWLWTFNGGTPSSSTAQNPGGVCWSGAGTYSVKLKVTNSFGTDSITLSNYFTAVASPPVPTITKSNDTLYSSIDISYTSYQWYNGTTPIPGATTYFLKISQGGNYNLRVTNSNGCEVAVGITVGIADYFHTSGISLYPVPAKQELIVKGEWPASSGTIAIYDVLGNKVSEAAIKLENRINYDVRNLSSGVYFIQITSERGIWMAKFVKE